MGLGHFGGFGFGGIPGNRPQVRFCLAFSAHKLPWPDQKGPGPAVAVVVVVAAAVGMLFLVLSAI